MIVPLSPFSRSIIMLDQGFWQRIMARNAAMTDWSYPAAELIFLDPETGRPMAALPSPRAEVPPPQPLNVMLNWQHFINYYQQETKNETLRLTLLNNSLKRYSAQVKSIERVYRERFARRFSLYPAARAGRGGRIPPSNEAAGNAESRAHGSQSPPFPRLAQWPDIASRVGTRTETHRTDRSHHYFEPRPMRAPVGPSVTYGQYLASSVVLRQNISTAQAASQAWPRGGKLRNEALERMLPGIHAVQEFNRKLRVDYRWRDITALRWSPAMSGTQMSGDLSAPDMAATALPVAGERGAIPAGSGESLTRPDTVFRAAPDAEFTSETILAGQGELSFKLHSRLDSELRLMERQTATLRKESRFNKIYLERALRELIFERRDAVRTAQSLLAQAQRRMLSTEQRPVTGGRDIIAERAVDRESFSRPQPDLLAVHPGEWSAEPYAAPLAAAQARHQSPAGDRVRAGQPRDKALDRILPGIYALRELNAKAFAPIRLRPITWGYRPVGEQNRAHEEAVERGQDEITAMQSDAAALRRVDAVMPSYREAMTDIIFRAEEAGLQAPAISSLTNEQRALRTELHELRQQQEWQELREQHERHELREQNELYELREKHERRELSAAQQTSSFTGGRQSGDPEAPLRYGKIFLDRAMRETLYSRRDMIKTGRMLLAQPQRRMLSPSVLDKATPAKTSASERMTDIAPPVYPAQPIAADGREGNFYRPAELYRQPMMTDRAMAKIDALQSMAREVAQGQQTKYTERTEHVEYMRHIERMERVADMRHTERENERNTGAMERQSRYNEFIERVLPGISAIQEWNVKLKTRLRIRDITWPHHLAGTAGTEAVSPEAWADELIAAGERREDAAMVLYRHETVTGERTETLMRRQELASVLRERRQQQRVSKIFIDRTVRELLYHDRQALQTGRGILERTARLMSPALHETSASGGDEVTGGKTASYSPYGGQGANTIDRRTERNPAEQGPKAAARAEPSEYVASRSAGAEVAPPVLSGSRQMLTMRQRLEGTVRFDYSSRMPMLRLAAWTETMNQAARTAEEELPALIAGDVVWRQPPVAEDIKSTTGRREQAAEQRPLSPQNRSAQEMVYQQEQTIRRLEAKVKDQGVQMEALLQQQSAAGELPEAEVAKLADKVMKRLSRELWMERQRRGMN